MGFSLSSVLPFSQMESGFNRVNSYRVNEVKKRLPCPRNLRRSWSGAGRGNL